MGKRILVVCRTFWPEESDINTIVEGFISYGMKVDLVCAKPQKDRIPKLLPQSFEGVDVYYTGDPVKDEGTPTSLMMGYLSFYFSVNRTLKKLKDHKYSAVFVYQNSPVFMGRAAIKAARKNRVRSFLYVVDLWPDAAYKEMDLRDGLLRRIFRSVSHREYKRAWKIITCSKETQRYLIREVANTPGRIAYAEPFSNVMYDSSYKDPSLHERFAGSFNFLCPKDISKNPPEMIILDMAERLISAGIRDIRFIFTGGGTGLAELKKAVDERGLYDHVFLEGKVFADKLSAYVNISDAIIYTENLDVSVSYAPPKDIIDYLSAGRPIVAAASGPGGSIIKRARCGLASDPEDAETLFENIMKMYRTPREEMETQGRNAQEYRRNYHSPEVCVDEILNIMFPENFKISL